MILLHFEGTAQHKIYKTVLYKNKIFSRYPHDVAVF